MRKYGLWVGLGVVVLVAAVVIGVVAVRRPRPVPEQGEARLPVGTDAMAFVLGEPGRQFYGYSAPVTDEPAKITQDAATQKAKELAGGITNGAVGVTAYHVLLRGTGGHQPSGGATGGPTPNFREQGQSVWMVVFKGITRPPAPSAGPPPGKYAVPTPREARRIGNLVVLIDAETGVLIDEMDVPMSLSQ